MTQSQYRRVVLKLSGEAFADATSGFGIDAAVVQRIAVPVDVVRARTPHPFLVLHVAHEGDRAGVGAEGCARQ